MFKIFKKSQLISFIILITGLAFFHTQIYAQDLFYECQSIPTQGAVDWESFSIGTDTFLTVANYYNGSTYNLDSKIYKWNGSVFEEFQSIPTHGAMDWESFSIGFDTFLAVVNHYNDSTLNIDSKIYKYKGLVANAGPNQVLCKNLCSGIVLDGRKSTPLNDIVSFNWVLQHNENPAYDRTAHGETPVLFDLASGFYDVTLTITDNIGNTATKTIEEQLEVRDTCNGCAIMKGDFDDDGDVDGDDLALFAQYFGTLPLLP
ncbi:MAG: hypothetical protein ACMUIP_18270 [bacterium]